MSTAFFVVNAVLNAVTIIVSAVAIFRSNRALRHATRPIEVDLDALRAVEPPPAGKRLLAELDRVQSRQFGVPMNLAPRGRGPHPVEWDVPETEPRRSRRSSWSRT